MQDSSDFNPFFELPWHEIREDLNNRYADIVNNLSAIDEGKRSLLASLEVSAIKIRNADLTSIESLTEEDEVWAEITRKLNAELLEIMYSHAIAEANAGNVIVAQISKFANKAPRCCRWIDCDGDEEGDTWMCS